MAERRGRALRAAAVVLAALCLAGGLLPSLAMAQATNAAAASVAFSIQEPRAFGYQVGDHLSRIVRVELADGLALDADSLPRAGARGQALELRSLRQREQRLRGGRRIELLLDYQVFVSPPEVKTLELPGFELRVQGGPRVQQLRIEAWPVTVAPLVPVAVSPRRGLGEQRPDQAPPRLDTRPARRVMLVCAALTLVLLVYLAQVYIGLPWLAARRRPFGEAWRDLKRGAARGDARAAWQRMHEALNRSAGEVLFEPGADRFLAREPQFAPLRAELAEFFARSRRVFFEGASGNAGSGGGAVESDRGWLLDFCRKCRDAERGSA